MNNSARSRMTMAALVWLTGCGTSDGGAPGFAASSGGTVGVPPGFGSGGALAGTGAASVRPGGGGTSGLAGSSGSGAPNGSGGAGPGGMTGGGGTMGAGGACTDAPPPNGDTCAQAVTYGWCSQDWLKGACAISCKKCTASAGSTGSGGTSGAGGGSGGKMGNGGMMGNGGATGGYPPIMGGSSGWASRYWDCCKPACGWKANVHAGNPATSCDMSNQSNGGNYDATSACDGGGAFMCWNGAPWSVNDSVAYGFAAASGSNYTCGRCYEVQFTGTGHSGANAGAMSLKGKTMIVQVLNDGGVAADQLDILIPGGGVGARNACSKQWNGADLGSTYGGYLAACNGDKSCVQQKCNTVFAGKPDLLAGCNWFLGWYNAADNPNLVYQRIACPAAITQRSGLQDPG